MSEQGPTDGPVVATGDPLQAPGVVAGDWDPLRPGATSPIDRGKLTTTLSDFSRNFVVLIDGLMVPLSPPDFRPVDEWMTANPGKVSRVRTTQLLAGLSPDLADRVPYVLLCDRESWPLLYRFLNQARAVDLTNRRVINCFLHTVVLQDPDLRQGEPEWWRAGWLAAVKAASAAAITPDRLPGSPPKIRADWVCDVVGPFPLAVVAFVMGGEDGEAAWYFDSRYAPPKLVRGAGSPDMAAMTLSVFPESRA